MEYLNPDQIKTANPYLRMGTDVSQLEKSIRTIGLINPLMVDENNVLLAGGRRFQAMLNIGLTEIPVTRVSGNELKKELISIDENLVRKDLNQIELEANLRRAKTLYAQLNDDEVNLLLGKDESDDESIVVMEEKSEENVEVLAPERFVKEMSKRTGLRPKQIVDAIRRDEKASSTVKKMRGAGELSVSQTNELIKLNEEDQEELIDIVHGKTVKEIREIVKEARKSGVESAKVVAQNQNPRATEWKQLEVALKKVNQIFARLELENAFPEGKSAQKIKDLIFDFKSTLKKWPGEEMDDYGHLNASTIQSQPTENTIN